jgi:aryl-alcohol dehydrogenase-like predicted oxidoreductase
MIASTDPARTSPAAAQPGVTAPIASATSVAQMEELVGAMALSLTTDQLDRLTLAGA